jgi:hypothetical protein
MVVAHLQLSSSISDTIARAPSDSVRKGLEQNEWASAAAVACTEHWHGTSGGMSEVCRASKVRQRTLGLVIQSVWSHKVLNCDNLTCSIGKRQYASLPKQPDLASAQKKGQNTPCNYKMIKFCNNKIKKKFKSNTTIVEYFDSMFLIHERHLRKNIL